MADREPIKYMLRRTRDALQRRLYFLERVARAENSKRKNEAYTSGGTHENSAWEAAIQDEKVIDHEISVISRRLQNSRIIEELNTSTDVIGLGKIVEVEDLDTSERFRYILVGPGEGGTQTPCGLLVSADSPLAKALLGQSVDDEVEITAGKVRRLGVRGLSPYIDDRTDDQLL
jgi:transcription elongation GreA/GreB family factor